jgi:alkylation response protein AidB-like acyl-CoA dehydrogenase
MNFDLGPEERAYRERLCAFLSAELTPASRAAHYDPDELLGWSAAFARGFQRRLGAAGLIGVDWPEQYGGQGRAGAFHSVLVRELEYHRAPNLDSGTLSYLPHAILRFCSAAQKRLLLPRLARGEIGLFTGYSEPEAGSDLANLSLRAVPSGDVFVLRGQKAFSSGARAADFGWVAARTDPDAPKHRGISIFIVDLHQPGITITSSRTVGGWLHDAVYFDDVVVSRDNLVGALNEGWRLIMAAIDAERATLASPGALEIAFDLLLAHLPDDDVARERAVALAIDVEAVRLAGHWLDTLRAENDGPLPESALALLLKRETMRAVEAAALDLLGVPATLTRGAPGALLNGLFQQDDRDHLYFHFAAGGFDITRNVIAARLLDLPRA